MADAPINPKAIGKFMNKNSNEYKRLNELHGKVASGEISDSECKELAEYFNENVTLLNGELSIGIGKHIDAISTFKGDTAWYDIPMWYEEVESDVAGVRNFFLNFGSLVFYISIKAVTKVRYYSTDEEYKNNLGRYDGVTYYVNEKGCMPRPLSGDYNDSSDSYNF